MLGGWTIGPDGSTRQGEAYFCGGENATAIADIYGESSVLVTDLPPAEGGPHVLLVTTDSGVRTADGMLLATTATQQDKVNACNQCSELHFMITQEDAINSRERGFQLSYSINPC